MQDNRVELRPVLDFVDLCYCCSIKCICCKPVNRFGRNAYEVTRLQVFYSDIKIGAYQKRQKLAMGTNTQRLKFSGSHDSLSVLLISPLLRLYFSILL
jgi:hypothetical protein